MGKIKSRHVRYCSVVDIHKAKKKSGKKNWNIGKRWLGRVQIIGTKKYRTKAFDEEVQAWEWAEDLLAKIKSGADHGKKCTISAIKDEYLAHLKGMNCSPGHISQCEMVLGLAIKNGINDLRHDHIASKVETFIHNLKAQTRSKDGTIRRRTKLTLSARTKNCYLNHLLALVSFAHKRRYLPIDPLHGIVSKVKGPSKIKPTFTFKEIHLILSDPNYSEPMMIPFAFTIYSGLRISEAMHVEWQDIDWKEGQIKIRVKSEYRLKGQKERVVLLPLELANLLRPIAKPHGWIVDDHLRTHKSVWRHYFIRLLKNNDIELDGRSPHSGRHTWACICSANGMDSFELKTLAGHASLQTTWGYCQNVNHYRFAIKEKSMSLSSNVG